MVTITEEILNRKLRFSCSGPCLKDRRKKKKKPHATAAPNKTHA